MASNAEMKAKYESLVKSASALYLEKQFQKALSLYNDAMKVVLESNMSKIVVSILRYMICCCLYESNKLEDLAEVVMTLQTMDRSVKNRFPAAYCLLAQTHCKLFRFELADMEFRNADAVFTRNPTLELYYIPGTESLIRPTSKNDETWLKIRQECLAYHQPDAICSYPDCNYVVKPYVIPNKNIFLKDPAFNGMVIVNCNNKDQPCVLKFHQSCWKMKKDELYPISKISDKDILGDNCFTPNCLNGNAACVISSIQVIDQKGELKAHIKENPSTTWSVKPQDKNADKNVCKGAIKKFKINPIPKKMENLSPIVSIQQHMLDSLTKSKATGKPTANKDTHSEDDVHYYDESQVIVVRNAEVAVDFSREPPEIAGEKSFLHTFFLDYIKKNRVTICDVYAKFNEYNQDLQLKDIDILGFLLQTNNFEILNNIDGTCTSDAYNDEQQQEVVQNQPNENFKTKSFDDDDGASYIDDVYYELMNDKEDEVFVDTSENSEQFKNYNFNLQDSNFNTNLLENQQNQYNLNNNGFTQHEAAAAGGGDASEHMKNFGNSFTPQSFEDSNFTKSTPSPDKGNENKKLKDYITKLESDMEKIIDENANLRKEITNKDSHLENYKKEYESYQEKIKQCEQLFETMTDFQKGYDNMKEENVKTKEDLLRIMKEKMDLEAKIQELEDPETVRKEMIKLFQGEVEAMEQRTNQEWEQKTDIFKKSLKAEIEAKMALLNKLLNVQYSSNKHVLTGYLDKCCDFVEVGDKVNAWMEKTLSLKNFFDNSKWLKRLELLQTAANELQTEYSKSLNELHAENEAKYKKTDINLKASAIPNAPSEKLCDVVVNALNTCYRHHYQVMQSYMLKAQAATQAAAQAMQYQMQPVVQSQTGYMQHQYPYVGVTVPTTPLLGITPMPGYHTTPRTAGPPPNLTLHQTIPAAATPAAVSQPPSSLPAKAQTVTPVVAAGAESSNKEVEKVKEEAKPDTKTAVTAAGCKEGEKMDTFKDKLAQMREAFKTIALNVKEKSNSDKSVKVEHKEIVEAEAAPEATVKLENAQEKVATVPKIDKVITSPAPAPAASPSPSPPSPPPPTPPPPPSLPPVQSVKDLVSTRDDRSDITTLTTREDSKSQKKIGVDGLAKMLLKKFPGAMECDVIEAIAKIRKERNNALTGIPVGKIIEEAKPHILQSQRLRSCPNL